MSFTFAMSYKPSYQRRYSKCSICKMGIEAGSKIMVGTGYYHYKLFKVHSHFECWLREVDVRAKAWFFANPFIPKKMPAEKAAELNRLRAKRYYLQKKGGEPNEVMKSIAEVEQQIALVKVG